MFLVFVPILTIFIINEYVNCISFSRECITVSRTADMVLTEAGFRDIADKNAVCPRAHCEIHRFLRFVHDFFQGISYNFLLYVLWTGGSKW